MSEFNRSTEAMTESSKKLYGPKQVVLIAGSMLVGICIFLFRRFHETGHIGTTDIIATVATIIVAATILVVMVRKGNKVE